MRNDLTKTMDTTISSETYQKGVFFYKFMPRVASAGIAKRNQFLSFFGNAGASGKTWCRTDTTPAERLSTYGIQKELTESVSYTHLTLPTICSV